MKRSTFFRVLPVAALVAGGSVFSVLNASAHQGREVGDFNLNVGFLNEPAYEGEPNGVSIRITRHHDEATSDESGHGALFSQLIPAGQSFTYAFEHEQEGMEVPFEVHPLDFAGSAEIGHDGAATEQTIMITATGFQPDHVSVQAGVNVKWVNQTDAPVTLENGGDTGSEAGGEPVAGIASDLRVTVTHVPTNTSREFELEEAWNEPGHYMAHFIPTAPGVYRFHFTGNIDGTDIDETFEPPTDAFSEIEAARGIQFPVQTGSAREVESAVRGVTADLAQTDDDVSSARSMGTIGIIVGAAGLVVGVGALAVAMRKGQRKT